ncbi:DedA family protein [Actinoplanes utahensis]|uniref:VTT domain-containing protein n=1 Tax=Actinoplanes utahensis TaxID=1869 RepID=A0A0A6UPW8_ACTUT|nr:DedA family protein [Actinoplanes utahensis]KHD77486.1 hypothetical protein MB27_10190 [Actinoplanes utahensis]GIF32620.1 membrane protein [Actinoplanes utahensis]
MLDQVMPLICSPWLYLIVFVAVTIDGFIPVVPSETVVIGLGAVSAVGSPNLLALVAAAVAGGVAGDRVSYLLGRKAGARLRKGRMAKAVAKAEQALLRYGAVAILVGRFLPNGRTATAMMSGSVSLPMGRFRTFSLLASMGWAVYAIGLGRLGGETFDGSPLLGTAFGLAIGTALAGVCALVERRLAAVRRRKLVTVG